MKIFKTFFYTVSIGFFFFITSVIYSQNSITNTLGTAGVFSIKDNENNILLEVADEGEGGSIFLKPITSVSSPLQNRLLNLDTKLYGNGFELGTAGNAGGWTDDGSIVRLSESTDKVGIGTSNPTAELEIFNTVDDFVGINITNTHTGSGSSEGIYFNNEEGSIAGIRLYDDDSVYPSQMRIFNNRPSGSISFGTQGTDKMTLSNNGNFGIGTNNPQQKLHVNGSTRFDFPNGQINISTPGGNPGLIVFASNGHRRDIVFNDAGLQLQASSSSSPTIDGILISENGYVGIGTDNPQGKLDVNGSIYQRGGSLHADYVFDNDYELETIEQHAEFMWKNKHLKAIPKATVDENGVEVVEVGLHRKGIVEELEKAHIYISQLENSIKELTDRLEKLEEDNNKQK